MRYAHILSRVTSAPWLITEAGGAAITSLLNSRLAPEAVPAPVAPVTPPPPPPPAPAAVARIAVRGLIGKNLSAMETMCGGVDVDEVVAAVESALKLADVGSVVLHIDSPGGVATGIPEAHAELRRLRAQFGKPLFAVVDGLCCSGGMYLAAACDSIAATRTAQLGSIGAIRQMRLRVGANAQQGIEVRTYKYGKFKDLGSPDRAPTAEEDAIMQGRIDTIGRMFQDDMRAARPQMKEEVYDALVYLGEEAVALGLADELIGSVEAYIQTIAAASV